MLLNTISSIIAFVLGAISVVPLSYTPLIFDIQSFFNPDTIQFIFRSGIGGFVALFVKVGGDIIIHKWKKRKKGGAGE